MAQSRYIIDNPEPPTALETLGSSVNVLGNVFLKKKMAEIARQQGLADASAKMKQEQANAIELIKEKTRAEQESPLGKLDLETKLSTLNKNRYDLGLPTVGMEKPSLGINSSSIQSPQDSIQQSQLIPESYEATAFGVRPKTFLNPEAKRISNTMEVEQQANMAAAKESAVNQNKLNRMNAILDTVQTEWEKTTPPGTRSSAFPFVGRALAGVSALGARLQTTPGQVADSSYISFINGIRAQLARSMGDVGNLSETEQKAAMNLVPTITDTKEVGLKKIQMIRDLVSKSAVRSKSQSTFGGQDNTQVNIQEQYNQLREQGIPAEEAKRQLGL
jgi:hypothetical protein